MNKVKLIFGTYNSLSPGNYDYIFEQAYQKAYRPFLTVLYNFPAITVTLQYSGILLQWLEEYHPEFIMLLNEMVKRRQVELLTGGFFDPVFTLIPPSDRIGQIEKLTTYLRKKFGKRPRGCWITELSWEPSFGSMFTTCGINYVFLDERQFFASGLTTNVLLGPCITEDQGKTLLVFPLTTSIASKIPNDEPEEILNDILAYTRFDEEVVISCITNGKLYGFSDEAFDRYYEKKWFERFFTLIQENHDKIDVTTPWKCSKTVTLRKRGYFPTTSSKSAVEMLSGGDLESEKDSYNADTHRSFFKGFLRKYRESNLIYAKMIYTGILVNQIRGDKSRKKAAREELWRGQNNYVFWHGNEPGIYSNHLRKTAYNALIEAEKITHEKGMFIPSIIKTDFDFDGILEYLFQGHELNGYVHSTGGTLFELDYLPVGWNYLDTMNRYKEPYHIDSSKKLCFDSFLRKAFLDRFFKKEDTINDVETNTLSDSGDFIGAEYQVENINREHNELLLGVSGKISFLSDKPAVTVKKNYIFKKSSIDVYYKIDGESEEGIPLLFGTEINLSLASDGRESQRLHVIGAKGRREIGAGKEESEQITEVEIQDLYNDVVVTLSSTNPFDLWSLPLKTEILDENRWVSIYQSTCFIPRWKLTVGGAESWETRLSIRFDQL